MKQILYCENIFEQSRTYEVSINITLHCLRIATRMKQFEISLTFTPYTQRRAYKFTSTS